MTHKSYSYSRRALRRAARKSKRNFIISLFLVAVFSYMALLWILPNFIGLLGNIKQFSTPPQKVTDEEIAASLAPPVFNIPYEATNSSVIEIPGYTIAETQVKLFLDEQEIQTARSLTDGSFVFQNVNLSPGINNIYGRTNKDDQMSLPSKTIKIIFDNEKPILEVNQPQDNQNIQGERKLTVSGKTEPNAKVAVNGSQTIVDGQGNFSSNQTLNDGDNIFNIQAQDLAGNVSEVSRKVVFQP